MPVLSMFYGIIVQMYSETGGKHHKPHIHVKYSGQEAAGQQHLLFKKKEPEATYRD